MCSGDKFSDAYEKFKDNRQLLAIGVNCTSPKFITGLLQSAKKFQTLSMPQFIVYSNDGKVWNNKLFK